MVRLWCTSDATETFIRATRVLPLEHGASGLGLDVVLAGPGLEDLFLERAVAIDVAGTLVPFISPEDLIVTKVLAGREKDLEDVRGVLSERGATLDVDRIRETLRLLEEALGQSDLMPVFDDQLSRWQGSAPERRRHPRAAPINDVPWPGWPCSGSRDRRA